MAVNVQPLVVADLDSELVSRPTRGISGYSAYLAVKRMCDNRDPTKSQGIRCSSKKTRGGKRGHLSRCDTPLKMRAT